MMFLSNKKYAPERREDANKDAFSGGGLNVIDACNLQAMRVISWFLCSPL